MKYIPRLNDYVSWRNVEGWVYFVDEEYLTIEIAVKPKDVPIVINQPGNPETMVMIEREMKVPAHINSGRRGILKILQNMKN